jgi:Rap1a immunity proteins
MLFSRRLCGLALCLGISTASAHAAVTQDSFLLHNTGDLVDLCSAAQSDPLYTPAVNFCHGFAVGVFQVLQEEEMAKASRHMFCPANPMPSRNEGIANFVKWVSGDPGRAALRPADAIATFLTQQFPCPRSR